MAAVLGRSAGLIYLGVVVVLLLGSGTPAFSLLINTSSPMACSSQCESHDCSDPATLRYGKYCGVGYTGCTGQTPCDGLDSCCATHDQCIGSNLSNYLNRTCNNDLKNCVTNFKNSGQAQFAGANCSASTVETVIIIVMDTATINHGNPSSLMNVQWAIISMLIVLAVML